MKCFPRNPNLRRIWKERVSRADWEPSNNSFLCHVHFDADQWVLSQSRRLKLKKNAIPSIFTVTSTRKSPRKRRKPLSCQSNDYLKESLDWLSTVQISIKNSYPSYRIENCIPSSNGMHDASVRNINVEVIDRMTNSEAKVKPEMKSRLESDHDLDDIERKLRLICDGEPVNESADHTNGAVHVDKRSPVKSRENGESNSDKDVKGILESIDKNRKSHCEITRHIEDTVAEVKPELKVENDPQCRNARRSTFTIKVTGLEEDVEEIVEGLGSEQLEYKSGCDSSRSNRRFVTSIISVTDSPIAPLLKKPKLEIEDSSPSDSKLDWNWHGNGNTSKLAIESLDDDESSIAKELREKIRFQEELIRKLTDRLMTRVESSCVSKSSSKREPEIESTRKTKIEKIDDGRESNENLLKNLSKRINNLEDTNKSLQKRLAEKELERKKFELQIRQRDNRIKELNWKLNKASKYVERAEKNAITYRKKMMNMQSSIAKRKVIEEKKELAENEGAEKNSANRIAQVERVEGMDDVVEERCVTEDRTTAEDGGLYRTVQDIFDENNDCDDDPCVIDTREDFIRQFKNTFEPRV